MKTKLILIMVAVLSLNVFAVEIDEEKVKKLLKDFATLKATVVELKKENDTVKAALILDYIKLFDEKNKNEAVKPVAKDLSKSTLLEVFTELNNLKNPTAKVEEVKTVEAPKEEVKPAPTPVKEAIPAK